MAAMDPADAPKTVAAVENLLAYVKFTYAMGISR
jgi:hypothetical protein